MKALRYDPVGSGYSYGIEKPQQIVVCAGEYTYIHLTTGDTLVSNDSLNTEA